MYLPVRPYFPLPVRVSCSASVTHAILALRLVIYHRCRRSFPDPRPCDDGSHALRGRGSMDGRVVSEVDKGQVEGRRRRSRRRSRNRRRWGRWVYTVVHSTTMRPQEPGETSWRSRPRQSRLQFNGVYLLNIIAATITTTTCRHRAEAHRRSLFSRSLCPCHPASRASPPPTSRR